MDETRRYHGVKRSILLCVALVAALCFLCAAGPALAQGDYAITWYTVDGGGAASSGGGYGLVGTAGQCDTGESTGGSYTVHGGLWSGAGFPDCNDNGIPDYQDIDEGTSEDCQPDGVPDECQLEDNDCNENGVPDDCDIAHGTSEDNNGNGIPDECECIGDIDESGAVDFADILAVLAAWGNLGGPEDLDGSGVVDFGDLLIVLANWGPC